MRQSLSVAMLIVGSMVGVGFASGQEIVGLFGSSLGIAIVPIVGLMVFGCSWVLLQVGSVLHRQGLQNGANKAIYGKLCLGADIFGLLNSLVVLAVLLAGASVIGGTLYNVPIVSIILSTLSILVLRYGISGLSRVNSILIPILIVVLVVVATVSLRSVESQNAPNMHAILKSMVYVSLNIYLATNILHKSNLSARQSLIACGVASISISILLGLVVLSLQSNMTFVNLPMPLLHIAKSLGTVPYVLVVVILIACIFGSMSIALYNIVEWLNTAVADRVLCGIIAVVAAYVLSMVGFEQIIQLIYPIIGIVGVVHIVFNGMYLLRVRCRDIDNMSVSDTTHELYSN
ncbi:MAG: hypothetical protein LBK70_02020 [Clostridiales bacterium]|nr:hypothetical protein [Clostridiales bacterium]